MTLSNTVRCALVLVVLGSGLSAHACRCVNRDIALTERIADAAAAGHTVFLGRAATRATVVAHTSFTRAAGLEAVELEQIGFSVVRAWSGPDEERIAVRFDQRTSCDASVRLGRYYLVIATEEGDGRESNRCLLFELTEDKARALLSDVAIRSSGASPHATPPRDTARSPAEMEE